MQPAPFRVRCLFCGTVAESWPRGVPAPAEGYRRAMATPDSHLEPHWRSAALLMVDLQRDFLDDGAAPV